MQIGTLKLENDIILAPLAGITNLPFRLMAKAFGCGLVCSEMVSANGLIHRSPKTLNMLATEPAEKPLSIQIFGSEPSIMADAAALVEASGADIIDINFGCSVRKVVKTGAGVALMRTPGLAKDIIKAVRASVRIPLTIKIRTGWTASGEQALRISQIAEDCGVDAVSVHPRTAGQRFGGQADWRVIAHLKDRLRIPVIGNGDIRLPEDAVRMKNLTGCDGVMVGRKAIGYPWIFTQIQSMLDGGLPIVPGNAERFKTMEQYVRVSFTHLGEAIASRLMRSRLCWFVKEMPYNKHFRKRITQIGCEADAMEIIKRYQQKVVEWETNRSAAIDSHNDQAVAIRPALDT